MGTEQKKTFDTAQDMLDQLDAVQYKSTSSPFSERASTPRARTPVWAQRIPRDAEQEKLTVTTTDVMEREFFWTWEAYKKNDEPQVEGSLKYIVNIPSNISITNTINVARGMSKCCYVGEINTEQETKECVVLIEPLNVPTLNEDVNHTVFVTNSAKIGGPFRDATPTRNNNVIEDQRIIREITSTENDLLPALYFMGVCEGSVDDDSLKKNYPDNILEMVKREMGNKYDEKMDGPDALKPTLFAVQVWEKYDMSLKSYVNTLGRTSTEVAQIFIQIDALRSQLNRRGFDHNDLHSGNIVINIGEEGPKVRFIDLGLYRNQELFVSLYNEFIHGTPMEEYIELNDIIEKAMNGLRTMENTVVKELQFPDGN